MTLVELMVAVSVLSILVLMFSSIFSSASRAWITGSGNVERRRNVRALTDFIGNELKAAMLPVQTVNNSSSGDLQFVVDPSSTQVPADYQNADCVFWQAPLATESSYGDIAEIGYFVKWVPDDSNSRVPKDPVPTLCRFFVNPSSKDPTSGVLTVNSNYKIFDPDKNSWLTPPIIDRVAPAKASTGYLGVFGENVVGLWIRCFGLDGRELPQNFDSRVGYTCNMQQTDIHGNTQAWQETRYLPAKVEVSIAQVDSHYAPRLAAATAAIRTLTSSGSIRSAEQFLQAFRQQAAGNKPLSALLPGMRIYSTEVQLTNAQ